MARPGASALVVSTLLATAVALPVPAGAVPAQTTVTQSTGVYLNDEDLELSQFDLVTMGPGGGAADVFPSSVELPHFARIVDVNVNVRLTHANPDDVQLVLAQPGGPQVTLMANAGGADDANDVGITLDDQASDPLPDESGLSSGTYKPTTHGTVSPLPAPAPAVTGNTSLGAFNGVAASPTWQLFVFDDDGSEATGVVSEWSVYLTYVTTPYPSEIQVAGVGTVTDLDVLLHGFTSTFPGDVELMLVGPTGAQVTLLSDAGGGGDVTDIELAFDDSASGTVPAESTDEDPVPAGTYRPTDVAEVGDADDYPAPAPATTGAASLAVFNGTNPTGTWRLYAFDEEAGDLTSIDAWTLQIDSDDSAAPTGSGNVPAAVSDTVPLDTTGPRATKIRPKKNAHVGPKAKVRVVASEVLDAATVTKRSIVLKHDGVRVKGKVTYLAARHTIVVKPRKPLDPGDYKVIVKTRITDAVGNRFDAKKKPGLQELTWTFTVG